MKKSILLIVSFFCFVFPTYAQLNILDRTGKEDILAKNSNAVILQKEGRMTILCVGTHGTRPVKMCLGKEKNAAIQTMKDLLAWFDSVKDGEYARIKDADGVELTIYRNPGAIYISKESGELIRQVARRWSEEIVNGITENVNYSDNEKDDVGYVGTNLIKKALSRLE